MPQRDRSILDTPRLTGPSRKLAPPPGMDPLAFSMAVLVETMDDAIGDEDHDDDGAPRNALEWAERYRRPRGMDFSLDWFKPLRALYLDESKHIVVMKPAQRGVSEWAINKVMYALDRGPKAFGVPGNQLNVGYIFPDQGALHTFSKERFGSLEDETPHLAATFKNADINDITMKRIRRNYLFLKGAWTDTGLKSWPGDIIVLDEYDEIRPMGIELAKARMNASRIRCEIDLSTPGLPGRGIHAAYASSDQHEYETECPECHTWSTFDFFRDVKCSALGRLHGGEPWETEDGGGWKYWDEVHIRRSQVAMHCPSCNHAFTDEERTTEGRWVARNPESPIRGYHIPWWAFPVARLPDYAVKAASNDPEKVTELFRSDLGIPYQPSGASINDALIRQASSDLPNGLLPPVPERDWIATCIGIDVGATIHYWITSRIPGEKRPYVRDAGQVSSWPEIERLIDRYRARMVVVDGLPETTMSKALVAKYKGRAVICFYTGPKAPRYRPEAVEKVLEQGSVSANRTMALDEVYNSFAGALWHMPIDLGQRPLISSQLKAMVRLTGVDTQGETFTYWHHALPDHLMHAAGYSILARELLQALYLTDGAQPATSKGVLMAKTRGWSPISRR